MSIAPNGNIRKVVSTLYVLTPLAIAGYQWSPYYTGNPDMLFITILVIFIFASGYDIYGDKIFSKATEEAKDLTGQGDSEEGNE